VKRPCLGCRALILKGSYCRTCQRERRGTGGSQQAWRHRVLKVTDGACMKYGATANVEAHHLQPIGEGGDRRGPGAPLCGACHRLAHRSP
jgi:hypothetical protein